MHRKHNDGNNVNSNKDLSAHLLPEPTQEELAAWQSLRDGERVMRVRTLLRNDPRLAIAFLKVIAEDGLAIEPLKESEISRCHRESVNRERVVKIAEQSTLANGPQ